MNEISMKACAKINLCLDVLGKRQDGYHCIRTVMQSIALYDTLHIRSVHKKNYIKIVTNLPYLPTDSRNLVYTACDKMIRKYSLPGVFIELHKSIPLGSGMGGGSTDAASAIKGLNELFQLDLPETELLDIAVSLGADVPFCLRGGTALCEGIGELITPLPSLPPFAVLVAKPSQPVSTKDVFKNFNLADNNTVTNIDGMLRAVADASFNGICENMSNVLENTASSFAPDILDIKKIMTTNGGHALMTGSGSAVFGLFENMDMLHITAKMLSRNPKYYVTVTNFATKLFES